MPIQFTCAHAALEVLRPWSFPISRRRQATMRMRYGLFSFVLVTLLCPAVTHAIPAFARQYQTSCTTCHLDFPKLNDFGKAFKDAGVKFPVDDETALKQAPVMLGGPAQKDRF